MNTRPRTRPPTRPGEILREEFLTPLQLTQKQLADHLGCDIKVINRIVNGARVTVPMARRLGAVFGTTAEFWLTLQMEVELYEEQQKNAFLPGPIAVEVASG